MIVVSCYTPKYATLACRLLKSAESHGLRCKIWAVGDRGGWIENTWHKPEFLLQTLNENPEQAICWIDADAVVVQEPTLFDDYERAKVKLAWTFEWRQYYLDQVYNPATYSLCQRNSSTDPTLSRGGTIYLSNSKMSRLFLNTWIGERDGCIKVGTSSQPAQSWAASTVANLEPTALPLSYCSIFDSDAKRDPHPVIIHYQASREMRK